MSAPGRTGENRGIRSTKDADEELARLFLGSVLGAPVTVHDRRSGYSTYDLKISYPGGRLGAAEVVSTRAGKQKAQESAISRAGYTTDQQLRHLWIACVSPDAVISRLLADLPQFLADLEQAGVTNLSRNRYYGPEMRERLRGLHVSSCTALPPTDPHPPGFYILPEATGGWVGDGEEIRVLCEEFLAGPAQADVTRKLRQANTDERHAVVIATRDQVRLHTAVDLDLAPSHAPSVDACVDWVWVIASQDLPARGCYWERRHGWKTAVLARWPRGPGRACKGPCAPR